MEAVGPYRIIAKLGEGGMGEVHLAEDTRLERRVAIKRLRDATLSAPDARQRVRDEARAAARLTHPNIAAVYDVIDTPAGPAIVLEYVDGHPLVSRVAAAPLPVSDVLAIGAQLADGLAAAHEQGVIHRDLKPGNICLTRDGRVKILDFGLARIRAAGATMSMAPTSHGEALVGTPGYCAPEQWLGGAADARTDLFSLGVVLYELSTGRRPYGSAYAEGGAARADALNPAVPSHVAALIDALIQLDPARRPASARAVHAQLLGLSPTAVLAGSAGTGRDGPEPPRAMPKSRAWAAAGAVLLAAVAGLPFAVPAGSAVRDGRPVVAVLPFHAEEPHAAVAAGLDGSLASDLSLMPGVVTVAREAVSEYRGSHEPLDRIAREVGAQYLIDGEMRPEAGGWLLDVRLARAERGDPVWRRQYTTTAAGLLATRELISDDLAAALGRDAGLPRPSRRAPTRDAQAFAHYAQALAFLDRRDIPGNLDRAVSLFGSAADKDPQFALAHAGLAQAYWQKYALVREPDLPRAAERSILDALAIEPEHPAVRYTAALIFNGTGREERAVEQLERILASHPSDSAWRLRAEITARRDVDTGLHYVDRAIALRPTFWENHAARGMICLRAGRLEEARAAFEAVTELQPDNAWGYQLLGLVHQTAGRPDEALRHYERAMQLAPTVGSVSNVATIHYAAGRYAEAAKGYERALELRPNDPRLHRNVGDAYGRLGDRGAAQRAYAQALALTREALRVNPSDAGAMVFGAVLAAKLGRHAEARREADRAAGLAPTDPEILYRRAVVLALGGARREAGSALQQALDRGYSRALAREDEDLGPLRREFGLRKE